MSIADDDVEFYRKDAPTVYKYFAVSSRFGFLRFPIWLIDVSYEFLLDLAAVAVTSLLVWLGYLFFQYSVVIAAACVGILLCGFIASISYTNRKNLPKTGNVTEVEAFTDIRIVYPDKAVALEVEGEGDGKMDSISLDSKKKLKPFDNRSTSPLKRLQQIANSPRIGGKPDHRTILGRPFGSVDMHRSGRRSQSTRKSPYFPRDEGPGAASNVATNHPTAGWE